MLYLTFFLIVLSNVFSGINAGNDYRKLHFDSIVIDAHNDVVQRMLRGEDISKRTFHGHSDLPRFKEGGVDVQIFSIWVPPQDKSKSYFEQANIQIDSIESFIKRNSANVVLARNSIEIERYIKEGKFVSMLGLEGGHAIDKDIGQLEYFYGRGVRYLTLTWNNSNEWATSIRDEEEGKNKNKGLTPPGIQLIKKMIEIGMLVDVSHAGERTFWDVVKITSKPIIASHSCAWALCPNRRNLKDAQLKAIAQSRGIVCINFSTSFIDRTFASKEKAMLEKNKMRIDSFRASIKGGNHSEDMGKAGLLKNEYLRIRPSLSKLIDHIDYIAKLIGVDYVGLGSDFDGIDITPRDMDDVTFLPNITRELLKRGYSDTDVRKILGGNFLRVLKEVEVK